MGLHFVFEGVSSSLRRFQGVPWMFLDESSFIELLRVPIVLGRDALGDFREFQKRPIVFLKFSRGSRGLS